MLGALSLYGANTWSEAVYEPVVASDIASPKVRVLSRKVRPAGIEPAAFRSGAERSIR